ncbi:MAG: SHOCT domain-containing protein [Chloroflexi bacterium]|nr:MAG: SHOCT domain-containing protein [Chloroflexota bacterium]
MCTWCTCRDWRRRISAGQSWLKPRDHYPEARQPETPLSILKSRYAKGEISKEEYAGMKSELQ